MWMGAGCGLRYCVGLHPSRAASRPASDEVDRYGRLVLTQSDPTAWLRGIAGLAASHPPVFGCRSFPELQTDKPVGHQAKQPVRLIPPVYLSIGNRACSDRAP